MDEDENLIRSNSKLELTNTNNSSTRDEKYYEDPNELKEDNGSWILRIQGNKHIGMDSIELSPSGISIMKENKHLSNGRSKIEGVSWDYTFCTPVPSSVAAKTVASVQRWSMNAANLLTITYRPRYQALPSYTNISIHRDILCRLVGMNHNCKHHTTSDNYSNLRRGLFQKKIDWMHLVYTHDDIWKIEILSEKEDYNIDGIGSCMAIQVYLRSKQNNELSSSGSTSNNSNSSRQKVPTKMASKMSNEDHPNVEYQSVDRNIDSEANNDSNEDDFFNKKTNGPIITFAIPKQSNERIGNSCKPLLWKVSMPTDPSIAIETVTVLNGSLSNISKSTMPTPTSSTVPSPTHVFLNGWQSWTFTGSVLKNTTQPKSALADTFSLSFNKGGTLPPISRSSDFDAESKQQKPDSYNSIWNNSKSNHFVSDFFAAVTTASTDFSGTKSKNDHYAMDDASGGPAMILGWLSQRKQFGLVTMDSTLSKTISMHCSLDSSVTNSEDNTRVNAVNSISSKPSIETDWAWCQMLSSKCFHEEPMNNYLDAVSQHNNVSKQMATPLPLAVGWCSWYHYYENITAQNLMQNFDKLGGLKYELDCNVAVVDDGYMTAWGDWDSLKSKFFPPFLNSNGSESDNRTLQTMRSLSKSIRDNGMRPGIWLAPYACDKHSRIAKLYPDWIIKNEKGRYANSSFCGKFFYGLDATNPSVRKHAFDSVRRAVEDWGFEALKLDFLYACCLAGNGKFDNSLTRAETMNLALETIREAAKPSTFIIGCGCPIGSGINLMNSMRISADTGHTWCWPIPWWDNGTLPSLKGMIRNTLNRSMLSFRWWHNDPDCLMLGDATRLTRDELISAASIVGMTSGMLLLSDDLAKMRKERLDIAKKIFPITGATAIPMDLHSNLNSFPSVLKLSCKDESAIRNDFGIHYEAKEKLRNCIQVTENLESWKIVCLSNWQKRVTSVHLSLLDLLKDYITETRFGFHVFEFWSSKYRWIQAPIDSSNANLSKILPPHGSEIFHLKPMQPHRPQYIGSTIHFSCGFEVKSFNFNENTLWLNLKNEWKREGWVFLFVPGSNNALRASIDDSGGGTETPLPLFVVQTFDKNTNDESTGKYTNKSSLIGRIIKLQISIPGKTSPYAEIQNNNGHGIIKVRF